MLAELRMKLQVDDGAFGYYQSSNMQGVLMEQIDSEYGAVLHQQGRNPYSQFLSCENGEWQWIVSTLTKEAYENILIPLQSPNFAGFCVKKKNMHLKILQKELKTVSRKSLMEEFYSSESERYLSLEFLSPTAFKQNGQYVNYPDLRLLFQSLMNKYGASDHGVEMFDEETLGQLCSQVSISRYRLHSTFFPLEGVKIPAFMGRMTIRIGGNQTMANYGRLLLRFGEYSGVGIKTGMGMGALRLVEKEKV